MRRIGIAVLVFCAFLLPGCGKKAAHKVIGVSLLTKEHVFYRDLEKGLRETAAKHNFDLIINSGD